MIKANELRIGNHVNYYESPRIVDGNFIASMEHDPEGLTGIALTEERLLKFGFICDEMDDISRPYYLKNGMSILYDDLTVISWKGCDLELEFLDGKIYVHQLQNLYFALTGEELINP